MAATEAVAKRIWWVLENRELSIDARKEKVADEINPFFQNVLDKGDSSYNLLLDHLEFFPEDIYITNKELSWTIVFTHEDDLLGKRLIMQDGKI